MICLNTTLNEQMFPQVHRLSQHDVPRVITVDAQ